MPFYLACSKCSKKLKLANFPGTKKIRCAYCRQVFRVFLTPTAHLTIPTDARQEPAKVSQAATPKPRRVPWLAGCAVVAALLIGTFFGHDWFTQQGAHRPAGFDGSAWKEYEFPRGKIKVCLPAPPTIDEGTSRSKGGSTFVVHSELPGSDLEFGLHFFPQSPDVPASQSRMEQFQKATLAEFPDSTLLTSRLVNWESQQGMELHLKTRDGEVMRRILFGKDMVYYLSVGGKDVGRYDQSIKHFLNSFQYIEPPEYYAAPELIPEPIGKAKSAGHQ